MHNTASFGFIGRIMPVVVWVRAMVPQNFTYGALDCIVQFIYLNRPLYRPRSPSPRLTPYPNMPLSHEGRPQQQVATVHGVPPTRAPKFVVMAYRVMNYYVVY